MKFFVEAKKPAHDLTNANYYYQTVRYGWNKTTPIAILTDFEEFHILDCCYKPDIKNALNYKIETFHYSQYTDEEIFKKIFYLFGRDAVAGGSLEKYAGTLTKPRGKAGKKGIVRGRYQQVDEAFLELLDGYRDTLAHAFKNKNPQLDGESLTEAVQRTLDRLVFIRFLEDKGIEEPMIINLSEKQLAWGSFITLCRSMEPKYNGLVFKPHPVIDSPTFVAPDDKTFSEICREISDPSSPYDFDTIPISILGSIYERFLGKIVTTTDKRAKVVEKPEVRKAGGVYYTPQYIVRYIVSETVGKLLFPQPPEGLEPSGGSLTPAEVAKLKIIDIACGSGSFLLEVYSQLLDYHTRYYNEFPEKAKKGDTETREGKIVLSHKKRQEILVNNIYGVDIDFQATEVTQLSLYLKLMEDVTMNDAYQFSLLKERMLPDLRRNIVCGNSLIGRDILDGKLFDDETERTLKPMNFEDVFPEIMNPSTRSGGGPARRSPESRKLSGRDEGGFDVVVGNPPYGANFEEKEKEYLLQKYKFQEYQLDSYLVFMERAIGMLKPGALLGYIIPNPWLTNVLQTKMRSYVSEHLSVIEIVHFQKKVFPSVTVDTEIVLLRNSEPYENRVLVSVVNKLGETKKNVIDQSEWINAKGNPINIFLISSEYKLIEKIFRDALPLQEIFKVTQGTKPYQVGKGKPPQTREIVDEHPFDSTKKLNKTFRPLLRGSNINRYTIIWNDNYWISFGDWLAEPRYSADYDAAEKLVIRQTGDSLIATMDRKQFVVRDNLYTITYLSQKYNLGYLLALLNGKLFDFIYRSFNPEKGEALAQVKATTLNRLPIRTINFEDAADKARHDHIVALVEQMLAAKAKHAAATTESEKNRLDIQIEALDRQIDNAVYELYGLTEEEIAIVEER